MADLACSQGVKPEISYSSPPGYNFDSGTKVGLDEEMDEISGHVFSDSLQAFIALNDEQGRLFLIPRNGHPPYQSTKFSKSGDFEELVTTGSHWYALKSRGIVTRISDPFTDSVRSEDVRLPIQGVNEFETLILDTARNRLIMICKVCSEKEVNGFAYDLTRNSFDTIPAFTLDLSAAAGAEEWKGKRIKPSAGAIHPKTGQWFILASENKLLLITDEKGVCQAIYPLNPKRFKQPESIHFQANGDMSISNEARSGTANIRQFPYQLQ